LCKKLSVEDSLVAFRYCQHVKISVKRVQPRPTKTSMRPQRESHIFISWIWSQLGCFIKYSQHGRKPETISHYHWQSLAYLL